MPMRKVLRFEVIGASEEAIDALLDGVNREATADWQNAITADLHVETVEELDDKTYQQAFRNAAFGEDWFDAEGSDQED